MPFNLLKSYSALLEIMHLTAHDRKDSLFRIFERDILSNHSFTFNGKRIRPVTKNDGVSAMDTLFHHLTTEEIVETVGGTERKKRIFESDRSHRLHWIKYLINLGPSNNIVSFSIEERDQKQRRDVIRTYLYDIQQAYVIIFEPKLKDDTYYLLTAYYLNKDYAAKHMDKKFKKRLPEVY